MTFEDMQTVAMVHPVKGCHSLLAFVLHTLQAQATSVVGAGQVCLP